MSHLRTSLSYLRRSPFQALAAINVLMVTFFVTTLLLVLAYASNQIITYFETRPQVIAFLKDEATTGDANAMIDKLSKDTRIMDVKYVSKEQALDIYKGATSDNPLLGELVSPGIFPSSVEFSISDLSFAEQIINDVKKDPLVESVSFTASIGGESSLGDVVNRLKTIAYYVRIAGLVAIAVLSLTSFLVMMVVVGLRITVRRPEIESLSLIGATPWFIKSPIVLEAITYSLLGVFMGWLLATVALLYATPSILNYFGGVPVLPRDTLAFFELLGIILGVEIVIGLVIAIAGSLISVSRSIGRK